MYPGNGANSGTQPPFSGNKNIYKYAWKVQRAKTDGWEDVPDDDPNWILSGTTSERYALNGSESQNTNDQPQVMPYPPGAIVWMEFGWEWTGSAWQQTRRFGQTPPGIAIQGYNCFSSVWTTTNDLDKPNQDAIMLLDFGPDFAVEFPYPDQYYGRVDWRGLGVGWEAEYPEGSCSDKETHPTSGDCGDTDGTFNFPNRIVFGMNDTSIASVNWKNSEYTATDPAIRVFTASGTVWTLKLSDGDGDTADIEMANDIHFDSTGDGVTSVKCAPGDAPGDECAGRTAKVTFGFPTTVEDGDGMYLIRKTVSSGTASYDWLAPPADDGKRYFLSIVGTTMLWIAGSDCAASGG